MNNGLVAIICFAALGFIALVMLATGMDQKHVREMAKIEAKQPKRLLSPEKNVVEPAPGLVPEQEPEPVIETHDATSTIEVVEPEPAPPTAREIEIAVDHFYRHTMKESHFVDATHLSSDQEKLNLSGADYMLLVDEKLIVGFKVKGTETEESAPIMDELIALHGDYAGVMQYAAENYDNVSTPTIVSLREQIEAKRKELRKLGVRLKAWNSGVTFGTIDNVLGGSDEK